MLEIRDFHGARTWKVSLNLFPKYLKNFWKRRAKNSIVTSPTNEPRRTRTFGKILGTYFYNHCVANSYSHKYWWFPTLPFLKTIYCLAGKTKRKVNKLLLTWKSVGQLETVTSRKALLSIFQSHELGIPPANSIFRPIVWTAKVFSFSRDRNSFIKN